MGPREEAMTDGRMAISVKRTSALAACRTASIQPKRSHPG